MKKLIFPIILIGSFSFAQTKDYSDIKKIDELRNICINKDKEILRLTNDIKILNEDKIKLSSNSKDSEVKDLKVLIKEINSVFLRDIFEEKYVKNESYFKDTDLAPEKEDNTQKFKNSNVIINSVMIDEINPINIQKCSEALKFNENYLKLFAIRKDVLSQKYDSEKVIQAIKDIDNLPALENNSKLFITKNKIRNYLENYLQRTCELKSKLEKLSSNKDQNSTFKQNYITLQNKVEFKTYPYLIQVIERVKKDVNDYSKNDLEPCENLKETTIKTDNTEVVKEATSKKDAKPKAN